MVSALAFSILQTTSGPLLQLADRLDQLRSVAFDYKRNLNYGSNGYKHELAVRVKVTFGKAWAPLGAKFEVKAESRDEGFDGVTYWCRISGQAPIEELTPTSEYLDHISTLKNSLIGLSRALRVAAGMAQEVETKGNSLSFTLKERELGVTKPLVTVGYTPRYEIQIDPKSGLPIKIAQFLKDRKDTITTTFTNFELSPKLQQ